MAGFAIALGLCGVQGCHHNPRATLGAKDPEKAAKIRVQMAAEYIRQGDLDAAKRALDQALLTAPKDPNANMMMGVLLQQDGSPEHLQQAEQYFLKAIARDSNNPQLHNNYGTYLFQIKRYDQAIAQLQLAAQHLGYEQRYRALENLGRIYLLQQNFALAEKNFKQALQVRPDSSISMLELSELHYLQHNSVAATAFYEQYVQKTGHNNQSARALWLGIRLARANHQQNQLQVLINQLAVAFPESPEYQRYLKLQYSTEAVWK
ncbi:type IV pilus biogenesis/stability protein PilW [Acinetobacter larvae]|uniref:Type IV pilus biogenesis/stability protein PilW n=1 Tax=Acinetobacter larvae TaxID=1789224 RepID=A0A1B2M476_9GAMM|nr:type IV pilus biogenesis/stability protein PilW [Acinetobacter larvae]